MVVAHVVAVAMIIVAVAMIVVVVAKVALNKSKKNSKKYFLRSVV